MSPQAEAEPKTCLSPSPGRVVEGSLRLEAGVRVALIAARWNALVTRELVSGAFETLIRLGARPENITVVWVPGSFELPAATRVAAASGQYGLIVGVGCLLRGDTLHFELIAGEATRGLQRIAEEFGIAVGFGVLTCDTLEQALARAGTKHGNKGSEAALAAVEQASVLSQLRSLAPEPRGSAAQV